MTVQKSKSKSKSLKATTRKRVAKDKGASPNTVAGIIALGGACLGFGASLLFS